MEEQPVAHQEMGQGKARVAPERCLPEGPDQCFWLTFVGLRSTDEERNRDGDEESIVAIRPHAVVIIAGTNVKIVSLACAVLDEKNIARETVVGRLRVPSCRHGDKLAASIRMYLLQIEVTAEHGNGLNAITCNYSIHMLLDDRHGLLDQTFLGRDGWGFLLCWMPDVQLTAKESSYARLSSSGAVSARLNGSDGDVVASHRHH